MSPYKSKFHTVRFVLLVCNCISTCFQELGLVRETEQDFILASTSRGSLTEAYVLQGTE